MVYEVTNITNSTVPITVRISDIPNIGVVEILPGRTRDLEKIVSRDLLLTSSQLRIHEAAGRITIGSEPVHKNGTATTAPEAIAVNKSPFKISNPSSNTNALQVSFDSGNSYFDIAVGTTESFDNAFVEFFDIKAKAGTAEYQVLVF